MARINFQLKIKYKYALTNNKVKHKFKKIKNYNIMLNLLQNLYTEEHSFKEAAIDFTTKDGDILASDKISGLEIRLSHVVIKDNKTAKIFPFPGLAKIYFLTLVVSDVENQIINLDLKGFEKVDDGDALSIDKSIFYWKQNSKKIGPSQVHVMTSIIKSKQSLRDVAKIMENINKDIDYKDLTNTLATFIKDANQFSNITNLITTVSSIVGKYLGKVEDKPLLTWYQSFTDIDGDWDKLGKTYKHAENKYAAMDLSITIRDKERD